jgi:hypothetical protein
MAIISALHVYAQHSNHSEARIAGTKDELVALREAITKALQLGDSVFQAFCVDGEGYDLHIHCVDDATILPVPYTADYMQASEEAFKTAPWNKLESLN